MKTNRFARAALCCASIAAAVICYGPSVVAQEDRTTPPAESRENSPATRPASEARPPNLERMMKNIDRALKRLEAQVKDESKIESSLGIVAELEQSTLTAKSIVPKQVTRLTGDERVKALTDYRLGMSGLLSAFTDLESALIDRDMKKVEESLKTIREIEKAGHEEMKVKTHD